MDSIIGVLIFGFVIYSIFKNAITTGSSKTSGSSGDFLANIDKIINTAYENTQQSPTTSSSSHVKKYKPKKRKKHDEKLSFTGSHQMKMNEEVSLETDFSDLHSLETLESMGSDEISLESMENDEISLETMFSDEISIETDCFLDAHAAKQEKLKNLKNKKPKGSAQVKRLLSFDSDSLVQGFVFKEIFDRRDLFSKK